MDGNAQPTSIFLFGCAVHRRSQRVYFLSQQASMMLFHSWGWRAEDGALHQTGSSKVRHCFVLGVCKGCKGGKPVGTTGVNTSLHHEWRFDGSMACSGASRKDSARDLGLVDRGFMEAPTE